MNLFTRNSPYCHLLKYLIFLLKHPVYRTSVLPPKYVTQTIIETHRPQVRCFEFPNLTCALSLYRPLRHMGEVEVELHILCLGTRHRWVVSFTPRPLYPTERGLGSHWLGDWMRKFGEAENFLPIPGIEPRFLGRPARSLVNKSITYSVNVFLRIAKSRSRNRRLMN